MKIVLFILSFFPFCVSAQLTDAFDDGNFTNNPTWTGDEVVFQVNGSNELQLNDSGAGTSYLSVPHSLSTMDDKEWRCRVKQSFSPSGSNFGRVYLTATSQDLSTDPDGFYLQMGEAGSNDAIKLINVSSAVHTEILSGPIAQISGSFDLYIKVTRTSSGDWMLYTNTDGSNNYTLQATVNEPTSIPGTHFGFQCNYTSSNSNKFYYDDVYIGDIIVDTDAPIMTNVQVISANEIDVQFNEPLEQTSAEIVANYAIQPTVGISSATLDVSDNSLVHLTLGTNLPNMTNGVLSSENIQDLSGNLSLNQDMPFVYYVPETAVYGDVIITEFMCDPTPAIGLPETEFVEVYNTSNKLIDLNNWKIADNSSSGTCSNHWLLPNQYALLVAHSDTALFTGSCGVSNFPSLNNSGDAIVLYNDAGERIDSIQYTDSWYGVDTEGGYSIELINVNDPCSDVSNWAISSSFSGGTPGFQNANYDVSPDEFPPYIHSTLVVNSSEIDIIFNEPIDTSSLVMSQFNVSDLIVSSLIKLTNKNIRIAFTTSIEPSKDYLLTVTGVSDCWMNSASLSSNFILPEPIQAGDLLINEILFNPISGSSDFIEIVNVSEKVIDLVDVKFGNYANDTVSNIQSSSKKFLLQPNEYAVFTEDSNSVKYNFPVHGVGTFIEMNLPSYSNDSATVYFMFDTLLLDKVSYDEDWHFQLLDDFDGKSLERIDVNMASDDSENWHTASEEKDFGTPGLKNSQFRPQLDQGDLVLESTTISPDGDGFEDVLRCSYRVNANGMVGNVTIFDAQGRQIKQLLNQELLASEGYFTWDGLKEDQSKAAIGAYILVFEAFDTDGNRGVLKKAVFTVAGKL